MGVFVVGVALHPSATSIRHLRLEEMAYSTARRALDDAGVTRAQLDSLTIGACDELDGRPISSMLMSAPAGGYGVDEIKVTNSGASALALAYARFLAGESDLGLVVSWCKSSKTDVEGVMRLRGEPFYTRPLGVGALVSRCALRASRARRVQHFRRRSRSPGQRGVRPCGQKPARDRAAGADRGGRRAISV